MSAGHKFGYEEFSEWERKLAKHKAKEKARRMERTVTDSDDLEQEFLLKIWMKREAYDANHQAKSSFRTFMRRVVENRFIDIVRTEQKDKRSIHQQMDSLDREIENDEGDCTTVGEQVEGESGVFESENDQLQVALNRGISFLSKSQRAIFHLLMSGYTIAEIARKTRTPWSSIKDEVARMRRVLYDAGLHDFVDARDSEKGRRIGEP